MCILVFLELQVAHFVLRDKFNVGLQEFMSVQ